MKTSKDTLIAHHRLNPPPGEDLFRVHEEVLNEHGPPNVLFIGSSHVSRLGAYIKNRHTTKKTRDLMANTRCIGVGGVEWWNVQDHIKGIGLPNNKQHLGNQWLQYRASGFHPHFVTLWLGSNDCDDLDMMTRHAWFSTVDPSARREKVISIMNEWFDNLIPFIHNFLVELNVRIPGCIIKYVPIFPRPWWSAYTHRFASSLDKYLLLCLSQIYRIRQLPVKHIFKYYKRVPIIKDLRDMVQEGLTEADKTHLNQWGYQVFCSSVMSPLLHAWAVAKHETVSIEECRERNN